MRGKNFNKSFSHAQSEPHATQFELMDKLSQYKELYVEARWEELNAFIGEQNAEDLSQLTWALGRYSIFIHERDSPTPLAIFEHPDHSLLNIRQFGFSIYWKNAQMAQKPNSRLDKKAWRRARETQDFNPQETRDKYRNENRQVPDLI